MGAARTDPPFNTQDQTESTTESVSYGLSIQTGQAGGYTNGDE